jgi:type I restriction enzyme, S subunit
MVKQGYKQTDVGIIPMDWEVKSLGDIFTIRDGTHQTPIYVNNGVPFYSVESITNNDFINTKFISLEAHGLLTKNWKLEKNDILMTRIGSVGVCRLIDWEVDASFYVSLAVLKSKTDINALFIAKYSESTNFKHQIELNSLQYAIPKKINLGNIALVKISLPTLPEQTAIAKVLTDMDDLITNLTELIAKKKLIKVGAMQVLLTPKEDWEVKKLGDIADIYTGKRNNQDKNPSGMYPFFVRSQNIEKINTFSFDGEAILIPGEGNIGKIFHYMNGKFDFHQRVYMVSKFKDGFFGRYIYRYISEYFGKHAMENSVKATVDSLRLPTFQVFEIPFPPTYSEQIQIAKTLSDIDKEIQDLEAKLAKYKLIKIGAMQKLLTGEIRLV